MLAQQHQPGRMAQSDFTSMNALGVSLAGTPFAHLVYHLVLTYSNVEAARVCFSESFEALSEGVDQALRVRGSRDFADRGAYERFLAELVRQLNLTRAQRFEAERAALRPLPAAPLEFTRELTVRVSRFSLVRVLLNHYSVPSRLIGACSRCGCAPRPSSSITARCWR